MGIATIVTTCLEEVKRGRCVVILPNVLQEIQDKTPSDPLEAELLMMAAAVSGDKQESSDSDTEDEALPDVES